MKTRFLLSIFLLFCLLGCQPDKPTNHRNSSTPNVNQSQTNSKKAQKHWQNPKVAKNFLDQNGIHTNQYKNRLGHEYASFSSYQDIGSGSLLPNNIAYYVKGDRDIVKTLKLVLNVNQPNDAQTAHSVMLKHSQTLYKEVFAQELPPNLKEAITIGNQDQLEVEGSVVTLSREDWVTGRGYSLELIIQ